MRRGLLTLASDLNARQHLKRHDAFQATTSIAPSKMLLSNAEARVSQADTVAFSPTAGCIYLNSTTRFKDGSLSDENVINARSNLKEILESDLKRIFGGTFELCFVDMAQKPTLVPDVLLKIRNVDFTDSLDFLIDNRDVPHTLHVSEGFVTTPSHSSTGRIKNSGGHA